MGAAQRHLKLAAKLSLLTISLILLASALIGTIVVMHQKKNIYDELIEDGITMAQMVAQNSHYGIYTQDNSYLKGLLKTLHVDPDIAYAAVFDDNGVILGHVRFHDAASPTAAPSLPAEVLTKGPRRKSFIADTGIAVDVVAPVLYDSEALPLPAVPAQETPAAGAPLGFTLIGVSKKGLNAQVRALVIQTIFSALAVILLGVAVTVYLTRRIVAPLRRLHLAADGISENLPVEAMAVTSPDEIGDLTEAFNNMVDALRKYRGEVEERTTALERAHDDLERKNEELLALDRMKNTFIDAVSHELKTPVAKHAMQIEILRPSLASHTLGEGEHHALDIMEQSIRRQQETIRNLLDLSRLQGGRVVYHIEDIALDEILDDVLKDYLYAISSYDLTVTKPVSNLCVVGDRKMLWHVFSNVINNAIKFRATDAPPQLTIAAVQNDAKATLSFQDNGIGLSRKDLSEVFSTFFQASSSIEGSGVGLSICRMIVEGLGGEIWIESPGEGQGVTTFISLPLAVPPFRDPSV